MFIIKLKCVCSNVLFFYIHVYLNVLLFVSYIHVYVQIKVLCMFQGYIFSAITTMDDEVDFNTELKQRYNWYGNKYMNVYY